MALRLAITFPLSLGVPGGGTEDCLNLARHMRLQGAEVTILSSQSSGPGQYPRRAPEPDRFRAVADSLERDGIDTVAVPTHPLHYLLDGRPMRKAVARLLAQRELDAVIGWWHEAAFLPSILRGKGVLFGVIAAASYTLVFPYNDRWRQPVQSLRGRFLVRSPLREASVVFVRSAFTRHEIAGFADVPEERVRLVPCGVDPTFLDVEREPAADEVRLFYFGRLVRDKGIFDAIAALGRLAKSGTTNWRLRVAGWGDVQAVEAKARELGIHDRLEFLGPLTRPALAMELARTDLAVLPSYSESFGLANAEAQAAGVPVAAYRAGAVAEVVVDGETGWLVPTGDAVRLSEVLAEAIADPVERERRGSAGRHRIAGTFTWENAARATLEGLEEALARRGARVEPVG